VLLPHLLLSVRVGTPGLRQKSLNVLTMRYARGAFQRAHLWGGRDGGKGQNRCGGRGAGTRRKKDLLVAYCMPEMGGFPTATGGAEQSVSKISKFPTSVGFATPLGVHPSPAVSHAACARGDHAAARLVAARPFRRGYNGHASPPPATTFHPCPAMSQSTPPISSTHSGLPSLAPSRKPRYT
jgi:hypothetical protein